MDFGLNETEEMVRASAQEFLAREAGPGLARDGDQPSFWQEVAEMGWPGLAIGEEYGGSGMGLATLGVLMEQWGAYIARGPLFESAALVAPLLEAHADERLKKEILPKLADGSETATAAVLEQSGRWEPGEIRATAVKTTNGWAVTGTKHFVSYGDVTDRLIVAARTGDGEKDISLFLINRQSDGISSEALGHATGVPTSVLTLNEVSINEARLIGEENRGWALIEELMLRGAAFRAVQLAGLGRRVLETTSTYVKERKQFGVPIGSFQAVQHHLADMAVSVRRVEHLARQAAWAVSEDSPDSNKRVAQAKHTASELIPQVCWTAHQCHGAIGFTWEHDLHLYTRHALSWAAEFGDAAEQSDRLAGALGL